VRPLIGITTYREEARWGAWQLPAVLLPAAYPDAVFAAGGEPLLLPTGAGTSAAVRALDGLVLAGGADVDPALYGGRLDPDATMLRPDRDAAEAASLRAALDAGRPVLGICRGLQLLNVVLGGTLVAHVPDLPGVREHDPGPGRFARHEVSVRAGSRLRALLGGSSTVDCHHHQAADALGRGLVVSAEAEDGVVEGVELPGARFCLGVQWHPEAGEERALFAGLVEASRR